MLAPVVVGVVGMGLELCLRRTYGKDPLYGLLLTFGAALVLEETDPADLGTDRALRADARRPSPAASASAISSIPNYRFFASAFAIGMIGLVWLFLREARPTAP